MFGELDVEDQFPLIAYFISTITGTGLVSLSFNHFNFSLTDPLVSLGGLEIPATLAIGVASLLAIILTNFASPSRMEGQQVGAVASAFVIMVLVAWVPAISSFVTGSLIAGLIVTGALTGLGAFISYEG